MENEERSSRGWLIGVIVVLVVLIAGVGIYYGTRGPKGENTGNESGNPTTNAPASDDNQLVVYDQFPGNIVYINTAGLAKPGFVVIHEDNNGEPGVVIGSKYISDLVPGPSSVSLSKNTSLGKYYYAMLHEDNGNKVFNAADDKSLTDRLGQPIMMKFKATNDIPDVKG